MATTNLYALALSHPARAARGMLVHKGIEHRVVNLLPGVHPLLLRGLGFRGGTVPALQMADGRRIQGSLAISRFLDEHRPDPPLFPAEPEERRRVEQAEAWGEAVLQDVARRIFRWGAAGQQELREWIGRELAGVPAPGLLGWVNKPVADRFARVSGATDERIRADVEELPELIGEVDRLIAEGTIGAEPPNAADFQILSSVRTLLALPDLRPGLDGRPAAELAERLFPRYPDPVPLRIPPGWIRAAAWSV